MGKKLKTSNLIETRTISTRITKPTHEALVQFLIRNAHINIADYLRDLVRKDLDKNGVLVWKPATKVNKGNS